MSATCIDANNNHDTAPSPTELGTGARQETLRQRTDAAGKGYRKQIGTTLEEAFLLSSKGKW